jgi:hypothetical protein
MHRVCFINDTNDLDENRPRYISMFIQIEFIYKYVFYNKTHKYLYSV